MKCYKRPSHNRGEGGEGEGRALVSRIFTGVSGGYFPCNSYGIATPTAGSLEFQDVIPGALVEAAFSEFRTKYGVDCGGGGVAVLGAGGIKSREGHFVCTPTL
ncbi:hypothetical protein OIU84_027360 [Salix udensis]|uniref:Uncharacterized protein n=1 Tax=Salix udensis TaxID=889485 RepID=A0AAD6KGR1_9ROSI|nr:hypothetical protein OIU84_027360 [Salix udensis]